jgi:hypothetical protein
MTGRKRNQVRRRQPRSHPAVGANLNTDSPRIDNPVVHHPDDDPHRRQAATACGWCGAVIQPKPRGRIPKWCSQACRQRAWEQSRAAASGRSAVEIVERVVEIPVLPIHGVLNARHPRNREWVPLLEELTWQLRAGFVFDRNLAQIARAAATVNAELGTRLHARH